MLGLGRDMPVYAYGEGTAERASALGFRCVSPLDGGTRVQLGDDLEILSIAADTSVDGVSQCAFLVETPWGRMLDAVDVKDSDALREAVSAWRNGGVELAFVPAGGSVQWQGYFNQMDAYESVRFLEWLRPGHAAACGGTLSLHAPPRAGALERYPSGFNDWIACGRVLPEGVELIDWPPPFAVELTGNGHVRVRAGHRQNTTAAANSRPSVSATAATFFTGYKPLAPTIAAGPSGMSGLAGVIDAWRPFCETIVSMGGELAGLARRCAATANQTPAGRLAPNALAVLRTAPRSEALERMLALIPQGDVDPDTLEIAFFDLAGACVAADPALDEEVRRKALVALDVDRAVMRIAFEHLAMASKRLLPASAAAEALERQVHALIETLPGRRPRLSPNHVLIERDLLEQIGRTPPNDLAAILVCAAPEKVRELPLTGAELAVLDLLDGRTGAEIVDALCAAAGMDRATVEAALDAFIGRLFRASAQLLTWR